MSDGSDGRVWFITGSSSGLGRELARAAITHGDRVVATARDTSALADLVALAPQRARAVRLDVTDPSSVHAAVAEADRGFGRIDVLVNNAGYGLAGTLEELAETDLRRQFETNLFGALAVTRAALPVLRRQRSGHIVQMSAEISHSPASERVACCLRKLRSPGAARQLA
jgi:NAD(P)-dependent dehydrogenase (short-subunit alcohol dehydrogenase family)